VLLAIDVGNTNTVLGLFDGQDLAASWRLTTDRRRMPDEWWAMLAPLLRSGGFEQVAVTGAIIDSSVPVVTVALRQTIERYLGCQPLVVTIDLDLGIRALVDHPREVGPDRLVNAVAAHAGYPGPAVVIDFGTATNFDVISADGDFLGGAIVAIGTNTITNMQSGMVYGYVGLVEGLIARMTAELGTRPTVIATGGLAGIIADLTPAIDHHDPHLTLTGLRLIYERQQRRAAEAAR
jgi:type III pantothenate kinase